MEKQKPAYRSYWMRGWLIWVLFAGFAAFIGGSIWLIIMEYQDKDSMTLGVLCFVGSIIFSVVCWLESSDSVFRLGGGRVYYRPGRGRDRALNQHLDVKEEDVLSFSYVSEKDHPSEMDNSGFMTWSFTPYLLFRSAMDLS